MAIPSSWWVPTVGSSGGPTMAVPPITRCMSRCKVSSLTSVQGSMEAQHRTMNVLLLTQEHCGFCRQAKEILDRLSVEYGLAVSTLDLDSHEGQVLAERSGMLFPPGIFLDGEPF